MGCPPTLAGKACKQPPAHHPHGQAMPLPPLQAAQARMGSTGAGMKWGTGPQSPHRDAAPLGTGLCPSCCALPMLGSCRCLRMWGYPVHSVME